MRMLDKKQIQADRREQVKLERLRAKKRKRACDNSLERGEVDKAEKPTILIVCEGENTEPSYFNQFKLKTADIRTVGEGYNTISLVHRAKKLSDEKDYDQTWCVFDKDDFSDNYFNQAVTTAESYGFHVAYSNQAFEYWLILHFNDHQGGALHRKRYDSMLNGYLNESGLEYRGTADKLVDPDLFQHLLAYDIQYKRPRIDLAISRAERIDCQKKETSPSKSESRTTVYKLVKEIRKYT